MHSMQASLIHDPTKLMDYTSLAPSKVSAIKAIIFDLDGTLYSQRKLRALMAFDLSIYYLIHPKMIGEIGILAAFRKERDAHDSPSSGKLLSHEQFEWAAHRTGQSVERVAAVVDRWIYKRPLKYLLSCRFEKAAEIFRHAKERNIPVAIASDYPVAEKMKALNLDFQVGACATDPAVNAFKPRPDVLLEAARQLGVNPECCLMIGDRDEKDGAAAHAAGMSYLKGLDACARFLGM